MDAFDDVKLLWRVRGNKIQMWLPRKNLPTLLETKNKMDKETQLVRVLWQRRAKTKENACESTKKVLAETKKE